MRALRRPTSWLIVAALTLVALYVGTYLRYRLVSEPALTAELQRRAVAVLRRAVEQREIAPAMPGANTTVPGPLWVSIYHRGALLVRQREDRGPVAARLARICRALAADDSIARVDGRARRELRIRVDAESGRSPVISGIPFVFAKSVVPGLDGIGITIAGKSAYLLPDDLFQAQINASYQPFYFMREFRTGLDLRAVVNRLAADLEISLDRWRASSRRYFRFRVQSFVDGPDGPGALEVQRARVPVDRIDRAMVREAVERAANYVLRQIEPDGRFRYIYYPLENRAAPPGEYSLPRHAGTTWFLSLAYRHLKEPRFRSGASRAIRYLGANAVPPACRDTKHACVGNDGHADLGSAALTVVAIAEYQRATGDRQFEALARRLGRFIVMMQRPGSGDFCHLYSPRRGEKNCGPILLYYTGEATLALAKLYHLTGDEALLPPLQRAMDFLTDDKYDFFLGQFFLSEDHWTCIAAEEAARIDHPGFVVRDQWAEFCYAFGALNARAQVQPGEGLMHDLRGAFTVTPFFMPHNTPAGSRTEANVATYLLAQRRKDARPELLRTIRLAVRYLVDQQLRPESAYLLPDPRAASGAMLQTPMRASVRIDYVQHAAAAMVRALPLIPERGWPAR